MTVVCPKCGSTDLDLVEVLEDERRLVKCEACGHEWLRGDAQPAATGSHRSLRDPAEAKQPTVFADDDVAYLDWVRTWPGGYVLNCDRSPSPNYLMLHRAHCDHITEAGSLKTTWTTSYIKVCSTDRNELKAWANECTSNIPIVWRACG